MKKVVNVIANQDMYPFILPQLPYSKDAFVPHFSIENFDFHHGRHHNAYVLKLNELIENDDVFNTLNLEGIIINAHQESKKAIFNNASQIWIHTFYWYSIKKNGGGDPSGKIKDMIIAKFGDYESFKKLFINTGIAQFGSGWVWLVLDKDNNLQVMSTSNADNPITEGMVPVIVCDVWEHAYYIDYRNRRLDYLNLFLDHLVDWDFANKNIQR